MHDFSIESHDSLQINISYCEKAGDEYTDVEIDTEDFMKWARKQGKLSDNYDIHSQGESCSHSYNFKTFESYYEQMPGEVVQQDLIEYLQRKLQAA